MAHVSRLVAFLGAVLLPAVVYGVACPLDSSGDILGGWPEDKSPSGFIMPVASSVICTDGAHSGTATGYDSTTFTSFETLRAQFDVDGTAFWGEPITVTLTAGGGTTAGFVYYTLCWHRDDNTPSTWFGQVWRQAVTATPCEPPPPDDEACGGNDIAVGQDGQFSDEQQDDDIWSLVYLHGDTWNDAVATVPECVEDIADNNCRVTGIYKTGPGKDKDGDSYRWLANIRMGGGACADPDPIPGGEAAPTPPAPEEEGEKCDTSDAGVEYCEPWPPPEDGENCGYYNDNFTCLDRTDEDECWVDADSSRYCGQDAPMPPVPDSGTPGDPATPDDTVRDPETDNEYDYYDPTTTGGSSRDPGSSGANPNRPGSTNPSTPTTPVTDVGDGDGDGEGGEGEGDGSASGGLTCETPPTCEDDPVQCAVLQQAWRIRCVEDSSAEILDAAGFTEGELAGDLTGGAEGTDIGTFDDSSPMGSAGACPAPFNITVWGTSIEVDAWAYGCDMAELFAPFVLAMGWLIAGLMFIRGI